VRTRVREMDASSPSHTTDSRSNSSSITSRRRLTAPKSRRRSRLRTINRFLRKKMALTGIVIILSFLTLALLAPILTNVNPIYSTELASPYAVPQWARAFPAYSSLPVDTQYFPGGDFKSPASLRMFSYYPANGSSDSGVKYSYLWNGVVGPTLAQGLSYDLVNTGPGSLAVEMLGSQNSSATGALSNFTLSRSFAYEYSAAHRFRLSLYALTDSASPLNLLVSAYVVAPPARAYSIMSQQQYQVNNDTWTQIVADSQNSQMAELVSPNNLLSNVANIVLSTKGTYNISVSIAVTTPGEKSQSASPSSTKIYISDASFYVFGSAYGVLGTDDQGRSVWSQFLYGARVSLAVGFFAAAIVILLASVIGITSGYYGGWVDETLMRFNDLLLTIPLLPLLLVLILVIDISHATIDTEELIVLLIGFLGWEVYARVIRSQVLSVKERTFVNAARTLGVKPRTIVRRHILPNVAGLIYALLSQAVPIAILLEAALSFLGFFDPNVISWGRMLGAAQAVAIVPTYGFVWWWFLPPGLGIALVSVSFIFVGNSLDEMFNPKLVR
jgi:peptide/nickel transport system permease protein